MLCRHLIYETLFHQDYHFHHKQKHTIVHIQNQLFSQVKRAYNIASISRNKPLHGVHYLKFLPYIPKISNSYACVIDLLYPMEVQHKMTGIDCISLNFLVLLENSVLRQLLLKENLSLHSSII